jgi:hypothetical protein
MRFAPATKVADSMPSTERARTAALLNVRAESGAEDTVKFDIEVIFQAVPVKRPLLRGHWFVACRRALVNLDTADGTITGRTSEKSAEFTYKDKNISGWTFGVEVKPTVKAEVGGAAIELGGIGPSVEKESKHSSQISHSGTENTLGVAASRHGIGWKISMDRGGHAISDFLYGNQELLADWKRKHKPPKGTVKLLPSLFDFDQEERQMGEFRSFLMQVALAFRKSLRNPPEKAPVLNQDGITLTFGER